MESNLGKVLVNLLLMKPFSDFGVIPNEEDYFGSDNVTQDALEDYFNHLILRFRSEEIDVDHEKIRESVASAMNEMCDVSGKYNVLAGNSISYRDFIRLEVEDPEADKMFHPEVKPGAFSDIEDQFKKCGKTLMNYFKEHDDTELHPFVASGTGIAAKQFTQLAGYIGLKPDIDGSVIPVTITDNFLKGLNSLESYYIISKGSRKALITNQRMTKKSGLIFRPL